jgi:phosphatidylserine/phosphatidylglycerophosphate/cardiolipin synthase-like enzyme
MRLSLAPLFTFLLFNTGIFAQANISAARSMAVGSTVTVTGTATNGSELAVIRYIQDGTAGIAVYSSSLSTVTRGSNITVTGTLKMYNNLLEIDPVTSSSVNSTGNSITPQVVTPSMFNESLESELVQVNTAVFTNGGSTFTVNTNYTFTSNGQNGVARITGSSNPLIGTIIPTGTVALTGLLSQFCSSPTTGCTSGYQLLLRDQADIVPVSSINVISPLTQTNINTSSFDVNWTTNISGSSVIKYGLTPALELGTITGPGNVSSHTVSLTGLSAGTIYYVKAYSVLGSDSSSTQTRPFATRSLSSGNIKIYFNRSVDNSYSTTGANAVQLLNAIDDTLIAYINRVQESLDIAIYNFDNTNLSNMTTAINNAYSRGVKVRIVTEGGSTNSGLSTLNSSINKIYSPTTMAYGLMHNKFVIMDANSSNPNLPKVWTGSTNLTDGQINTDPNNVIIIQDQSLARSYELEFEEMWGDTDLTPNTSVAKFGPYKTDNTPHEFVIGGNRVESFFSPSDGTNGRIIEKIQSANTELQFETMLITRTDIANELVNAHTNGIDVLGVVDNTSSTSTWSTLIAGLGSNRLKDFNAGGTFHHKTLIVDQSNVSSDPLVLAGSHNWSTAAETKNDENTLVIHDDTIANIYYQEFIKRFTESGGTITGVNEANEASYLVYPNPANDKLNIVCHSNKQGNVLVSLKDLTGKLIYNSSINATGNQSKIELNTSTYSAGSYILTIQTEDNFVTKKVILQ